MINLVPISAAVEDELSEAVVRRLLKDPPEKFHLKNVYRRGGNGYLRANIRGWNKAAVGHPFFVLTDLDSHVCSAALIESWLPVERERNLIFRVAVREVESWLLADPDSLSEFLQVSKSRVPSNPDVLRDPKQQLVELARKSRSRLIRSQIVPRPNSTATEGREYNSALALYVRESWRPASAVNQSPSLKRAVSQLLNFEPVWRHT